MPLKLIEYRLDGQQQYLISYTQMYLRPPEIRFSQDTIGRTFGCYTSHPYRPIGETLYDIFTGKLTLTLLLEFLFAKEMTIGSPQTTEKRGKCTVIYVQETFYFDINKLSTINNGISVVV